MFSFLSVSVFLLFYLHFFLSFFFLSSLSSSQHNVVKKWKSIPGSAKDMSQNLELEMSQGWTGYREDTIQERELLTAHLESQLGRVGWSQPADPLALCALSSPMLSAFPICMCVYITRFFSWILSLHPGTSGALFSPYVQYAWRAKVQKVLNVREQTTRSWYHLCSHPTNPSPRPPLSIFSSVLFYPHPSLSQPSANFTFIHSIDHQLTLYTCIYVFAFPLSERKTPLGGGKGVEIETFVCFTFCRNPSVSIRAWPRADCRWICWQDV